MARQDGSTATQQDQAPKEYKPETQAGSGILTFDEILGLTDVKFLEFYGRDSNSLDHLTDEQLGLLMERCAATDPELRALKAAATEDTKPAGPEDATLDQIDQILGKVGYQSVAIDNLLQTGAREPGNVTFDGLSLAVTDAPSEPLPCILEREGGGSILYASRFSSIHGEPGRRQILGCLDRGGRGHTNAAEDVSGWMLRTGRPPWRIAPGPWGYLST